jgi:hypothetical protein
VLEPELLVAPPGTRDRAVPEDIREYRAERHRAAGWR